MSKTQPLLDLYAELLESLNIVDVADGRLSLKVPNEDNEYSEVPCLSNDKRVVLPTDAILRSGNLEGVIAFHPLSENLLRGESEIIHFLRKMVRFRLASVASQLLIQLMTIAADPEMHEDLSPRQAEFLRYVPHANAKTVKVLSKVLHTHFDDLLNIYLKRDGARDQESYRRLASVSFPIYEELTSPGSKIFEIDAVSVKNKKTIASLFEFVFPDVADPSAWSVGSNSGVAPYFDALVRCYAQMARHLARLVYKYRKYLDHPDLLKGNLEWEEKLDNLDKWKTLIPALPGNKGATAKGEEDREAAPAAHRKPAPAFQPDVSKVASQHSTEASEEDTPPWEEQPAPRVTAPGQSASPTVQAPNQGGGHTGGKVNWHDVMSHRAPVTSAPAWGSAPVQSHTTFPMPGANPSPWGTPVQQPGYPQQNPGWGGPNYGGGTSI